MLRARALFPALLLAALLTPVTRADAASTLLCNGYSSCASKGYGNFGYSAKQGSSYWAMYTGTNCTNYVAYRLVTTNGMPNKRPKSGVGNARDWGTTMASITDATPTVGSVAWWGSKVGGNHVAYVEKVVSSSEIWVSESNWSGAFDWRKVTRTGSGWPQGFIHFADPQQNQALTATTAPRMTSAPRVGAPVTLDDGVWAPSDTGLTFRYQWLSGDDDIPGATGTTFTPTAALAGARLAVRVVVTKPGLKAAYVRTAAAIVQPDDLTATTAPSITGTTRVGQVLSAVPGRWLPDDATFTYRWLANGATISGANRSTLTLDPSLVGKSVRVQVAARHPDYELTTALSPQSAAVSPGTFTRGARPVISGTRAVGRTLTASDGTWSPAGESFTYQWVVANVKVPGATRKTFTLRKQDAGHTVLVYAIARRPGYTALQSLASDRVSIPR